MHRKVAAALLAALALGIAGCGGSEETLSRAQLTSRIQAACRQAQRAQEARMRRSARGSGTAAFIDAVVAGQKVAVERIDELHPTDAVQSQFDAFKQGMQDRVDLFERVASVDGSDAAVKRAVAAISAAGDAINRRLSTAARRLGVEGCV
jgi:hypothetical protein